jgi:hypothetical protein
MQVLLQSSLKLWLAGTILSTSMAACTMSSGKPPSLSQSIPATPTQSPSASQDPSPDTSQQAAVQVIRDYYDAINRRDYDRAYQYWANNGEASNQSFDQFKQGFSDTASVIVEVGEPSKVEGAAGSLYIEIPITLTAKTVNGSVQHFTGSYSLRRVNHVPGATLDQQMWNLYSAHLRSVEK